MKKRIISMAMVAACLVTIIAVPAQAGAKKTIYVLNKVQTDGGTAKYSYNKSGYITKWMYKYSDRSTSAKYVYNKKKQIAKETLNYYDSQVISICKYRKKGTLKQIDVYWSKDHKTPDAYYKVKTDKAGNVTTLTIQYAKSTDGPTTYKYHYTYNKKGRPVKSDYETFKYNKKGDIIQKSSKWETVKYKNTYDKKGNLIKVIQSAYDENGTKQYMRTTKYSYRKISVNKKDYAAIKKQQTRFPVSFDGGYHGFTVVYL